jgi:hypothetical protein
MRKGLLAAAGAALALLLGASPAAATTFTVTNGTDHDPGSLRAAMDAAEADTTDPVDQINFTYTGNIDLTAALPQVTTSMSINGPGAGTVTVRRGSGTGFRLFEPQPDLGATITIQGLTISGAQASGATGGGVSKLGTGALILDSVVITGNSADQGGGFFNGGGSTSIRRSTFTANFSTDGGGAIGGNTGDIELINSTIDGNSTNSTGGGITVSATAHISVLSSTITRNNANADGNPPVGGGGEEGGGTYNNAAAASNFELANTLIAFNKINGSSATDNSQCASGGTGFGSLGYNLRSRSDTDCTGFTAAGDFVVADPVIDAAPALNSGPTPNVALLAGSPAIDVGNPATPGGASPACPATDQRGLPRGGLNGRCDIGAFEVQVPAPPPATTTAAPFNLKAAIRKCKRKFPKGPKRKKCIKRAKRRAGL